MKTTIAAWACGLIFGIGLTISGMTNPEKIIRFVDFTGQWDPSLAFVMVGALITFGIGFPLTQRSAQPLFAQSFQVPTRRDIDPKLIGGAALFGVGWGLSGICPGPSITALAFGLTDFYIFFAAMVAGSLIFGITSAKGGTSAPATT
ncbi:MAG: DUF6691 family protein [Alphaproteobacteria bacterium]